VRRRSERSCRGFTNEILRLLDLLACPHDERLNRPEHVENENAAVSQAAPDADGGGRIANSTEAELVGRNRAIDVAP